MWCDLSLLRAACSHLKAFHPRRNRYIYLHLHRQRSSHLQPLKTTRSNQHSSQPPKPHLEIQQLNITTSNAALAGFIAGRLLTLQEASKTIAKADQLLSEISQRYGI
jgi:hypothetical protein